MQKQSPHIYRGPVATFAAPYRFVQIGRELVHSRATALHLRVGNTQTETIFYVLSILNDVVILGALMAKPHKIIIDVYAAIHSQGLR